MDFDLERTKANLRNRMRNKLSELIFAIRIAVATTLMNEIGNINAKFLTGKITPTQLTPEGWKLKVELEFQLTAREQNPPTEV